MLTLESLKGMKASELRDECKALGLNSKGVKAELTKRLEEAIAAGKASGPAVEDDADGTAAAPETAEETAEEAPKGEPMAVRVETEAEIPQEVADKVVEYATEAITDMAKAEENADEVIDKPNGTDAGESASADGPKPIVVGQVTTVTEEKPGEFMIETRQETVIPAEGEEQEPPKPEIVSQAISEAVEAAVGISETTEKAAAAEADVAGMRIPVTKEEQEPGLQAAPDTDISAATATDTDMAANDTAEKKPEETVTVASTSASGQPDSVQQTNGATLTAATRLFVGCVPYQFSEDDLKAYFEPVGALKDISILRDQITGNSRGCAFAVFEDQEHAEAAIQRLDKKQTLPGANQPIEVRFAKNTNKVQPTTEPNDRNQLFFARAPIKATEAEIREVFAEFGEMTEVSVFGLNRNQGISKGCGYVSYKERSAAEAALANLNEKRTLPGGFAPLTVKWADTNFNEKKRRAAEELADPNRDNNQIFFARIPNTVTEEELKEVFKRAGSVKEVVLFKTHASATINKRCGIVTYHTHEEAVIALDTLHETHTFPGMDMAMVLKWVDQDLQKRRKMGHDGPGGPPMFGGQQYNSPYGGSPQGMDEERPPMGCDRDAFKLFLSGVPKSWDVPDLKRALEEYGSVVECNLVRDKVTKEPRGVAFAWMKNRAQADRTIRELHNRPFDHGVAGQRAINVSKARPRRPGPGIGGPGGYQPTVQAPYMPRASGAYQGGYGTRPQPAPYQQPYYPPAAPAYDPYAQAPQAQQPAYNYQTQQAAPGYGGYQAQPAPAQAYNPPPASTYQQTYTAPTQTYAASTAVQTSVPSYSTAQGYDTQAQGQSQYVAPQQGYGAVAQQTYAAPSVASTQQVQGGYNYGTPMAATNATAQRPAAQASQYSYSAPAQGYSAPTDGYNYSLPQN